MLYRFSIFIFIALLLACGSDKDIQLTTYFSQLPSTASGISFSNDIVENDTLNYFTFPYLYMGGGVAVGDINNDGLSDIYLTGNMVPNRLYLNQGGNKFADISESAGIAGDDRWYTGATMADVNGDGWLDIYVSVSGKYTTTENQLFINNQDNTFSEQATEYGLNDASPSIQATFFDYDKDGFLDVYVATYPSIPVSLGNQAYQFLMNQNKRENSGHLYRNQSDGTYQDVTEEAGMQDFSLALGIVASDINNDRLPDLYVSNDFNIPDYLYLNQGDGTFKEQLKEATNHTSMFGMGTDVADFNNDGWMDILQVDMTPEDYKRAKTNMASMLPDNFYQAVDMGFHYQYMQNSLQLNNGVYQNGIPQFSDIARFAGVATTDWSWGALLADLDNDGWKDVLITNGMKRDVNNNDANQQIQAKSETVYAGRYTPSIDMLPSQPINNYIFRNQGDLSFTQTTEEWGLDYEGFSNGIAYADLDNDGDLDVVINNLDAEASVFINETNTEQSHYLTVRLEGPDNNTYGLNSQVTVKTADQQQWQEITLTRGFQSSVAPVLHFGLGEAIQIESVEIIWPDGKYQQLKNISANQILTLSYESAEASKPEEEVREPMFKETTHERGIEFVHQEDDYDDFRYEPLLPHRNSQQGPGLAVGDINNDGLEDFFVGNAAGQEGAMYLQNSEGQFEKVDGPWQADRDQEDTGALLYDADNDQDLDLYVVSGGNNRDADEAYFRDRLYLNTPQGFVKSVSALPPDVSVSGQVVIPADYDRDGDLDLFVGGRLLSGRYPYPASSFILQNEGGTDQQLRYRDVTNDVAPFLQDLGLVTTALWDDYDEDGQMDLMVAGEWMNIRVFKNEEGNFREVSDELNLTNTRGWWYSLHATDVDGDGDRDYLAGNLGLNYKYKSSEKNPFVIYASDFDENGRTDIVLSYEKNGKQLPVRGRECSSQQMPIIQDRFPTYEAFAEATLGDIYGEEQLEAALDYQIDTFASGWLEKTDNGLVWHPFPNQAQLSSINAIAPLPTNSPQNQQFIVAGNLYTSEVETPRNDAGYGLVLQRNTEEFTSLKSQQSGLYVRGEVKEAVPIQLANDQFAYLFAINNDSLRLVEYRQMQ
ncbi:MAG: VCBS repeat-containing protein [Bacteroidota bacterium]